MKMRSKIELKNINPNLRSEIEKWKRETLIRYLNAVFETVEFPAGISDLDTGLTNVDWNALSHFLGKIERTKKKRNRKWKRSGVY
jgi:hypothetical protein